MTPRAGPLNIQTFEDIDGYRVVLQNAEWQGEGG